MCGHSFRNFPDFSGSDAKSRTGQFRCGLQGLFFRPAKKEDYNLDKVFQVEKWIFLVDAACSLGVGMNRFPDVAENILLVVFGVTLAAHVYVFKSKKFRKENE